QPQGLAPVIVTDGGDSNTRLLEQKRAASLGNYALLIWLDHTSADVKQAAYPPLASDLSAILSAVRPRLVYTHNPADKHDTHVAIAVHTVQALRANPSSVERVLGCEVWRALDWLQAEDKVTLDVSAAEERLMPLIGAFDSQIAGGKRYDLAVDVGVAAAGIISRLVAEKPDAVLGLATGASVKRVYAELHALDFSRVTAFVLDEYVGLSRSHPASFHAFMEDHFLSRMNVDRQRVHFPPTEGDDLAGLCEQFECDIRAAGGI